MKLISWNVNGLRAALNKGFLSWFKAASPDVLCLQETKAAPAQLPPELRFIPGYHVYYSAGERRGYSGAGVYSRSRPKQIDYGFGMEPRFDCEGRIVQCDFDSFVLLNIYFPNGNLNEERLQYKLDFYDATLEHCRRLRAAGRGVIVCGDVNTAHCEIDLTHPKKNQKVSGFLPIEREWIDTFLGDGFVDSFRETHPGLAEQYSWWALRTHARDRNVGWRLDYFFVSKDLWGRVSSATILPEVTGSDHCPVALEIDA